MADLKLPPPIGKIFEDGYWNINSEHYGRSSLNPYRPFFGGVEVYTAEQVQAILAAHGVPVGPVEHEHGCNIHYHAHAKCTCGVQEGCDLCRHPLFAGVKCKNCGRVVGVPVAVCPECGCHFSGSLDAAYTVHPAGVQEVPKC